VLLGAGAQAGRGAEAPIHFNRQVLPILSDACFHCHGPDAATRKADLRLDQKEGLFRTKDGLSVVVPGSSDESDLYQRLISPHEDERMPLPESARQLKPAEIAIIKAWIEQGAPWSSHWAFSPPVRAAVPAVSDARLTARVRTPIDAFVFSRLAAEHLEPSPEASRVELLRRVSLDLTGVPPAPEEVEAFLADAAPDAYERQVDRLLASPRYGQRWAWDWLDLARYADTNGFQGDPERTMWPWRDWVVNALNDNVPYDRFSIEQLAGDLLPEATVEQRIASGFHRNTMFNGEGGRIPEETRVENVFDRVETTGTVWMGLTFSCARCHDHKFDPIKHTDYFSLYDIFNQMSEIGAPPGGRTGQVPPLLDLPTPAEALAVQGARERIAVIGKDVEERERALFPRAADAPLASAPSAQALPGKLPQNFAAVAPAERSVGALNEAIAHFKGAGQPEYVGALERLVQAARERDDAVRQVTRVMIMDEIENRRETVVLARGNYEARTTTRVEGAIPEVFRSASTPADRMNRLDLARWLVSAENPLGARTAVNRAWQAFFGVGFVKTAEDFGVQSEAPSHPELLDWLSTEYVRSGWDTKALHRLIVTSSAYRQSSRVAPTLLEKDPDNRLLARGSRHRLPSWMLRDQALAAAGLLVDRSDGPGVLPYQPAGIWEEATFGTKKYVQGKGEDLYRRSLYVFWRRIVGPTSFFDSGARQVCTVKVGRTNTPMHALVTLNDPAFVEAARVLAQRVLEGTADDDASRIDRIYRLALARPARADELRILGARMATLRAQYGADPAAARLLASSGEAPRPAELDPIEHAAWTALCSLVLNLDETLCKE
jgi:hypothetical protein